MVKMTVSTDDINLDSTPEAPRGSTRHRSSKYLNGALCIWEITKNYLRKLRCQKVNSEHSSKQFLKVLFTQNAAITIGYFLIYLEFGMCVGFMGPTMEDLACYTEQTVRTISWAFFMQTCFMVIGILAAGLISKWLSADLLLLISVICLPVTLVIASFSKHIIPLSIAMAIMGLAMGMIDCLANLQLVHIYDKAVAPFLQAMHFCYGIGALISPLIAQPFLLHEDCSKMVSDSEEDTTPSSAHLNTTIHITTNPDDALKLANQSTKVYQAFWVMAAIQVPIVIFWAAAVTKRGLRVRTMDPRFQRLITSESKPILQELEAKEKSKVAKGKLWTQWQEYLNEFQGSYSISFAKAALLTMAACCMVFVSDGLQGEVNEFIETYTVKIIQKQDNHKRFGYVNVSFWTAYSFGRLSSVVMAIRLTPYFMLLINICGCQIAIVLFLSCMGGQSFAIIVGAAVLLGLFLSSVTPTTITMTEHFMDMTNLQMSLIIGGAALGEMIIPIVEGQLIDKDPTSFVIMLTVLVALAWLVYAIFWLMGRVTQKYKAMASPSFIWYNPQDISSLNSFPEDGSMMEVCNYSDGSTNPPASRNYNSTDQSSRDSESTESITHDKEDVCYEDP